MTIYVPVSFSTRPLQPYNLGIVSARPFTVLGEYGPPVFQRGVLHVYFVHIALHVFIVHLHAHSSSLRIVEAESLHKVIFTTCFLFAIQ